MYSGWLSDKLGRRKPLATLGYTLTRIFISFFAFAYNALQVLFYRTVRWIGKGVREPPREALLADSVEPENYGHAFGFHRMMDTLAILVFALFTKERVCRTEESSIRLKSTFCLILFLPREQ